MPADRAPVSPADDDPREGMHVVAVCGLVVRRDRVLAMRRAAHKAAGPGLWEALSGRVAPGEAPLDAVRREIAEECGLEPAVDPRPVDAYAATRRGVPMVVVCYRADVADDVPGDAVRLSAEHDAYRWLTAEEFAATSTLERLVAVVRTVLGAA